MKPIFSFLSICAGLFLFVPFAQGQEPFRPLQETAELYPLGLQPGEPLQPAEEPATIVPSRRSIRPRGPGYGDPRDAYTNPPPVYSPSAPKPEKPVIRIYSLKEITGEAILGPDPSFDDPFTKPHERSRVPHKLNPLYSLCFRILKPKLPPPKTS